MHSSFCAKVLVDSSKHSLKGGLPVVRALSLHLEEGTGDAGGAGGVVAGAGAVNVAPPVPAEEDGLGPVRPVRGAGRGRQRRPDPVVKVAVAVAIQPPPAVAIAQQHFSSICSGDQTHDA